MRAQWIEDWGAQPAAKVRDSRLQPNALSVGCLHATSQFRDAIDPHGMVDRGLSLRTLANRLRSVDSMPSMRIV